MGNKFVRIGRSQADLDFAAMLRDESTEDLKRIEQTYKRRAYGGSGSEWNKLGMVRDELFRRNSPHIVKKPMAQMGGAGNVERHWIKAEVRED